MLQRDVETSKMKVEKRPTMTGVILPSPIEASGIWSPELKTTAIVTFPKQMQQVVTQGHAGLVIN